MDTWHRTRDGWRLASSEISALPQDPPAVSPPTSILKQYVGIYRCPAAAHTPSLGGGVVARCQGNQGEALAPELQDQPANMHSWVRNSTPSFGYSFQTPESASDFFNVS